MILYLMMICYGPTGIEAIDSPKGLNGIDGLNATIYHDGDGSTMMSYYGHDYEIKLNHSNACPCKAALH